jgi:hypothetical protein
MAKKLFKNKESKKITIRLPESHQQSTIILRAKRSLIAMYKSEKR